MQKQRKNVQKETTATQKIRSQVSIGLLGPFKVWSANGREITIAAKKNRALIAVLALSPGMSASREKLGGLLWGDRQDEQARSSLRQALAVLRKEIDDASEDILLAKEDIVQLSSAAVKIDVADFLALSKLEDAASARAATDSYRGDLLEDFSGVGEAFENWLTFERARLRREAIQVFDRMIRTDLQFVPLATVQRLVALDPFREASHILLMQTYVRDGERTAAVRHFEGLTAMLAAELGVEPSPQTRSFFESLNKPNASLSQAAGSLSKVGKAALKPSLAVMPFKNLNPDTSQVFLSDGITDDLITELSRFRNLQVFARRSTFSIGQGNAGQELGATYVLEGSVRVQGTRVRVTVQLSQTVTGEQVWSERYDRDQTDILALQEDLARTIAGTLAIELDDHELQQTRNHHLGDFRAYEHWLQGKRMLWTEGNLNLQARQYFQKAVDLDPGFARAHAGLGVTYVEEALQFPPEDQFDLSLSKGIETSAKAVELDSAECLGHAALAWSLLYSRRYEQCRKHLDMALKLNPNDADMHANASYILAMYGEGNEAVQSGKAAIRLNPRTPEWYLGFLGTAFYSARRHQEGIEVRERAPDTFYDSRFFGASMLARLGRIDEAGDWARIGMEKLRNRVGEKRFNDTGCVNLLLRNNPFRTREDQDYFAESMRMAGVPG